MCFFSCISSKTKLLKVKNCPIKTNEVSLCYEIGRILYVIDVILTNSWFKCLNIRIVQRKLDKTKTLKIISKNLFLTRTIIFCRYFGKKCFQLNNIFFIPYFFTQNLKNYIIDINTELHLERFFECENKKKLSKSQ